MKRKAAVLFAAAAAASALAAPSAIAKTGDVIGNVYSTDILAYVNGLPINSYNIGGRTVVIAEELDGDTHYGFDSYYNDESRTLTVKTRGYKAWGKPNVSRGKSGGIIGKVYETDIKVLFNNKEVKGYNIGGKTAICIEDLGSYDDSSKNAAYGYSDYMCNFNWNSEKREIELNTYIESDSFLNFPVKKLQFKLNNNILSASFDQENSYESWLEVNMTDEFESDTYRIKDMLYNDNGAMRKVGTMYVDEDGTERDSIDFGILSRYTEGLAEILSYEEATKYVQDNFAVLDKRSYDLGDSYIAQRGDKKYWLITYKNGGFVCSYGTDANISLTFKSDSAGIDYVDVYPFGGPHGTTTMSMEVKSSMEYYQFN